MIVRGAINVKTRPCIGASPFPALCPSTRARCVRCCRSTAAVGSRPLSGGTCPRGGNRPLVHEQRRARRSERWSCARGSDRTSARYQAGRTRFRSPPVAVTSSCLQPVYAGRPCCSIQRRMSSARQTVTRSDSFTGVGNVRACTRHHSVDLEMGPTHRTGGWRRTRGPGNAALGAAAGGSAASVAGTGVRGMIGLSSAFSRQRS